MSLGEELRESADVDVRSYALLMLARAALERGAAHDALRSARAALESRGTAGEMIWEAYAVGVEAALERCDEAAMASPLVDGLPPARATSLLRAGRARLAAEHAHRRGNPDVTDGRDRRAIELLRSLNARPLLARALLERGRRCDDGEALAEARYI